MQDIAETSAPPPSGSAGAAVEETLVRSAVDVPAPSADVVTPKTGERVVTALREILETLVFALLVFLLVQAVWKNFKVEGSSMEPNIHDGQYLIVNRLVYSEGWPDTLKRSVERLPVLRKALDGLLHGPERGDVIVFIPPNNPRKDYIKRVVGLPGDKVEIKQGRLFINDRTISEPYLQPAPGLTWGPAVVGKNELFVLGDNRANSSDSRAFGMLARGNVLGKAWVSYWPPRTWGTIRHADLEAQMGGSR